MLFGLVLNFDGCFFDSTLFLCFGKFGFIFLVDVRRGRVLDCFLSSQYRSVQGHVRHEIYLWCSLERRWSDISLAATDRKLAGALTEAEEEESRELLQLARDEV